MFLWWCFCGGVLVGVFLCEGGVCVVVCVCVCGGVFALVVVFFALVWLCLCGGVFVVVLQVLTEAMLVLKDCHRTTDAGKVVELSVGLVTTLLALCMVDEKILCLEFSWIKGIC